MNSTGTATSTARSGTMSNAHSGIFTQGARGPSPANMDHELHVNLVRDIIRTRRDQRRARLQQRCRTHSNDTTPTPTPPPPTSRSVTPLKRQPSHGSSNKPDSPLSFASSEFSSEYSSDFSPCVSPLMEDLMLEIKDAIQSSDPNPELGASPKRTPSAFDMDDIFRLIEEAQREYESLSGESEAPTAQRNDEPQRQPRWSWESLLGHP